MSIRKAIAGAALGVSMMATVGLPATAYAAPQTYQYSFQEHGASDSFIDTGLCDPGPALIDLTNYNEAFHVSATQPNLTKDQVEALLEGDNDVITKLTYTQTGDFVITDATGVVYTGKFTSWFGGSVNNHTMVFSGTFSFHGTGSDGSRVSGNFNSHVTFVNGEPVVSFDKGHAKGCPA